MKNLKTLPHCLCVLTFVLLSATSWAGPKHKIVSKSIVCRSALSKADAPIKLKPAQQRKLVQEIVQKIIYGKTSIPELRDPENGLEDEKGAPQRLDVFNFPLPIGSMKPDAYRKILRQHIKDLDLISKYRSIDFSFWGKIEDFFSQKGYAYLNYLESDKYDSLEDAILARSEEREKDVVLHKPDLKTRSSGPKLTEAERAIIFFESHITPHRIFYINTNSSPGDQSRENDRLASENAELEHNYGQIYWQVRATREEVTEQRLNALAQFRNESPYFFVEQDLVDMLLENFVIVRQ